MGTISTEARVYRGVPVPELRQDYRTALVSRALDDREVALQAQSRVFFQISGAGHEAILTAVARELRPGVDWSFPYYRDRAFALAMGVTPEAILLQAVGSAEDPSSAGRQMPCHFGDPELRIVSQTSSTASQCLPAVGVAEAIAYLQHHPDAARHSPPVEPDEVVYVSIGDGATAEGEFWEAINTAAALSLPVLFLVADNGYAISVRTADHVAGPISDLVAGFAGLTVEQVDGTDYVASRHAARRAVAHLRAGRGPVLVHATVTRPYSHSSADTQAKYRSPSELLEEADRDPLLRFERDLVEAGVLTAQGCEALRAEVRAEVLDASRRALAAPRPDPATVLDHVVALPPIDPPAVPASTGGAPAAGAPSEAGPASVGYGEAINQVLHEAMAADPRVRVLGEDVADGPDELLGLLEGKGGVFGTTAGLQRRFGADRCTNTMLAEAAIVGRAVGQAVRGLRPVAEIQFFDYIWPAMHQIKTEAATMRWRSAGRFTVPMVLRVPIGGYLTGGAIWHSQSGESLFAHIPGLVVLMPSNAADAAGLLRAALRCEDPVLFLEHKHLLRQPYARRPATGPDHVVPIGVADLVRAGDDVTVVTWGATVERSRQAIEGVEAATGASVELIDLRSILPWDREMVAASVATTGRLVVVHEDIGTAGFGAEVVAWAAQHCFEHLDAPVERVTAQDCHVAYEPTLERAILPQVDDIAAALHRVLAY